MQEPPTVKQGGGAPPPGWPATGTITYENVTASYRPGLPPVLSDLSFTIQVSTDNVMCVFAIAIEVISIELNIQTALEQILWLCQLQL